MKKFLKEDLVSFISEKNGITKTEARKAVDYTIESIKELVHEGNEVNLVGFAKFFETITKERKGYNPNTGEEMTFKSRKICKVKISPNF